MPTVSKGGRSGSAPPSLPGRRKSWDPRITQASACSAVPGAKQAWDSPRFFYPFLTLFPRMVIRRHAQPYNHWGPHSCWEYVLEPRHSSPRSPDLYLILSSAPPTGSYYLWALFGVALSTWSQEALLLAPKQHTSLAVVRGKKVFPESSDTYSEKL